MNNEPLCVHHSSPTVVSILLTQDVIYKWIFTLMELFV